MRQFLEYWNHSVNMQIFCLVSSGVGWWSVDFFQVCIDKPLWSHFKDMGIQISSRKRSELLHCNLETAENPYSGVPNKRAATRACSGGKNPWCTSLLGTLHGRCKMVQIPRCMFIRGCTFIRQSNFNSNAQFGKFCWPSTNNWYKIENLHVCRILMIFQKLPRHRTGGVYQI